MKAKRIAANDDVLLDVGASIWGGAEVTDFSMWPTPLSMVAETSPFLARSEDHGVIKNLRAAAVHNGNMIALRLNWAAEKHDKLGDLDSFVDGVAVLFPTVRGAPAATMGAKGKPTNAWYWKANAIDPFEVVAEGFASVQRLKDKTASDLKVAARHQDGEWNVILRRSLVARDGLVKFKPGGGAKIAFAVWSGGNAERSGRKSFSGEFVDFEILK